MYIYLYTPHHGGLGCPTILSNRDCIDFLRYLYKVESVVSKMYLHTVGSANIQGGSSEVYNFRKLLHVASCIHLTYI